jgi:hypothetical protein
MPRHRSRTRRALDELVAEVLLDGSVKIILVMAIVNILVWLIRTLTGTDLLVFPLNLLMGLYDVLSVLAIIRLRLNQVLR